jgi:hypothetical protein
VPAAIWHGVVSPSGTVIELARLWLSQRQAPDPVLNVILAMGSWSIGGDNERFLIALSLVRSPLMPQVRVSLGLNVSFIDNKMSCAVKATVEESIY